MDTKEQTAPPTSGQPPDPDEGLFRGKLKKLLLYRLILAVFFLILTVAVQSSRNADLLSSILRPLYVFSCILFIFTILGALSLQRVRQLVRFAWVQLVFDLCAVTVLVHMTGGIESSFSSLYMLVIISSALLLNRRASLLTASACTLAYGLLLDLQYFGWISPLQLVTVSGQQRDSGTYFFSILMNTAGFFLVGFLAGYLVEELHRSGRRVREREKDLSELAILHGCIVRSMSSGLLTIDLDGGIIFSNNAGEQILGMKSTQIAGRHLTDIFSEIDMPGLAQGRAQEGTKPPARLETVYTHPTGAKITIGYSASILQDENAKAFGWIINFIDMTKLKTIEEHIQRMERLVIAGRFAAEIAHEIKNPLAAMSGAMQMLQGEVGQNELNKKLMGIVLREIERINGLVGEFLWMAKGSPKSAQVEDVAVCPVIEEIIALLRARKQLAATHSIRTDFEAAPIVAIDPNHLQRVLWNLLVNALEAMPQGGELSIRVAALDQSDEGSPEHVRSLTNRRQKNGGGAVRIDIGDTGPGIAKEALKRIFDPFFTTKSNGTGLGLSIAYQLVEKAGGRIEVSGSEPGRNTVFSLFFPESSSFSLAKRARGD
jgi:two-component system sensor histidine kinase PilS (NtrC family)